MNREFKIKKGEDGLIDITTTTENTKRKGKYIHNLWIACLTAEEAKDLIEKLNKVIQ